MGLFDRKLTNLKEPKVQRKQKILGGGGDLAQERIETSKTLDRVLKRQHQELEVDKMARQAIKEGGGKPKKGAARPAKKQRKE